MLQSLPFSSLWDAERGQYLVEAYLLGVAPSGNVFVRASAATDRAKTPRKRRLLAVGNPRLDRASKLPNLPGAEAEANAVAALYGPSQLLIGRQATKTAFVSSLRESDVVHFAGHAVAAGGQGEGALLLAPDPQAPGQGALYSVEIDRLDLHATRVVVLAGCRTAAGPTPRLEGALSLARPFLVAGVPSVVASLRDVDDQVAREFALALHRGLLAGAQPARAVREAQLALLRDADAARSHPSSWAGFVSIGGL